MSQTYTLTFVNNSTNTGNACVYQKAPDTTASNVMSLAWFSKVAAPTTHIDFDWTIDYSFVWSETGTLAPGVNFSASQNWPADLTSTNAVSFTNQNGAFTFLNQRQGTAGSLTIIDDGTIPMGRAAVGIGMSGRGAFAVQAQPNLTTMFTPHPNYWITFGNYRPGEVLDVQSITNAQQISFPINVYAMTAILNADNTWTVLPTSKVNALFLESRERSLQARWGDLSKHGKVAALAR
jgi:hypothetical protein